MNERANNVPPAKANSIADLRRVCKPQPLSGAELAAFFVETNQARDPHCKARECLKLELQCNKPARLLFYGHPGCGKSTELNKFLAEAGEAYLAVQFSIFTEMTPSNVLAEDLILVMVSRALELAKNHDLRPDESALKDVFDYFSTVTKESSSSTTGSLTASAGVDTSETYLSKLIGLFAKFGGEIRVDSHSSVTSVATLRKRPADLIARANEVFRAIQRALGSTKRLLLVVEDIDKLDLRLARDLYVDNINLLTGLDCDIIYTIPIDLVHSSDGTSLSARFDCIVPLPMIKVWEPGNASPAQGVATVRDIILARVDKSLIAPEALDLLIAKTGGVLRHAFHVLHTVATMSDVQPPIQLDHVRYGLDKLRNDCWRQLSLPLQPVGDSPKSTEELFDRLAQIANRQEKGEKPIPTSDAVDQILLKCCALVEYNGEGWVGVHPLIVENLRRLGRLDDVAE